MCALAQGASEKCAQQESSSRQTGQFCNSYPTVSHDCHSYLHIILANGIPLRRAMVMAGENAANDVDEEVYGNDGAERHEAQEASAADRRAIADADQAGQLDIFW